MTFAPDTKRVGGAGTGSRPGVERAAKTTIEAAGATVDCTGDTVYADRRPTTDRIFADHRAIGYHAAIRVVCRLLGSVFARPRLGGRVCVETRSRPTASLAERGEAAIVRVHREHSAGFAGTRMGGAWNGSGASLKQLPVNLRRQSRTRRLLPGCRQSARNPSAGRSMPEDPARHCGPCLLSSLPPHRWESSIGIPVPTAEGIVDTEIVKTACYFALRLSR